MAIGKGDFTGLLINHWQKKVKKHFQEVSMLSEVIAHMRWLPFKKFVLVFHWQHLLSDCREQRMLQNNSKKLHQIACTFRSLLSGSNSHDFTNLQFLFFFFLFETELLIKESVFYVIAFPSSTVSSAIKLSENTEQYLGEGWKQNHHRQVMHPNLGYFENVNDAWCTEIMRSKWEKRKYRSHWALHKPYQLLTKDCEPQRST